LQDISNLEVLQTPEASVKDNTSFLPLNLIFDNFQKLAFLLIPETHASEVSDLSPEELEILILKTEILIERILQESIETEIRYNK
jgi:diadenosine tetraphosphate (Ap4A) HIT family hydrolase